MKNAIRTGLLITAFLAMTVLANQVIEKYGVDATPVVAASLIGPLFIIRDLLNDSWRRHGSPKMLALIAAGALVSYLVNDATASIAKWSAIAFVASETVDWVTYMAARRLGWSWMVRSSVSNVAGGSLDSVIFISGVFGFSFLVVFAQACAKIAGALIYTLAANPWKSREPIVEPVG